MAEKDTDIKKIKELIEMMVANDLVEIEIIDGDNKILLKRPQPQQMTVAPMQMMAPAMPPADYAMPQASQAVLPPPLQHLPRKIISLILNPPSSELSMRPQARIQSPMSR